MRYLAAMFCSGVLLMFPLQAGAIPAITCHCFTDRSFEPERPAAADPYFLATTQNTFMSLVFRYDKKSIVIKKQQGVSADDLWVACWIASRTSLPIDTLLEKKAGSASWKDVCPPVAALGSRFLSALKAQAPAAVLADIVADEQVVRYRLLGGPDVAALRKSGASSQEMILAALIAARTRHSAREVYLDVKRGHKTWGTLLNGAGMNAGNLAQVLAGSLSVPLR